jgi:predicted HAD superfamily Cof-like phosphohydrolase
MKKLAIAGRKLLTMAKTPSEFVEEFHAVFNLPVRNYPELPKINERILRIDLLTEEYEEYLKAENFDDLIGIADGLADIVYIAFGTALAYGIPLDAVMSEVHRSNMSKLENGVPLYREDGKVIKGPSYSPPNIPSILYQPEAECGKVKAAEELNIDRWSLDGVRSLEEAAKKLRDYADELEEMTKEGWQLSGEVSNDYGLMIKE